MMRRFSGSATPVAPIASVLAVLATLLVPAVAQATTKQYVLTHPKREHCRAHYVKKVERVKVREHGRTVKVRETVCVYVAPKKTPVKATTPVTPAPTPMTLAPGTPAPVPLVTLHAHLDPSFAQSPSNPLAVTYSYSASATETINGTPSPNPNLPTGILNLYSDGLLKCSINVGGSTTGGECPVTYSATGKHTVITTYTSGTLSATETYVEQIEPSATTMTDSATVEAESGNPAEKPHLWTVTVSVTAPNGNAVSGEVQYTILDTTTGAEEAHGTLPTGTVCEIQENTDPFVAGDPLYFWGGGGGGQIGNCGGASLGPVSKTDSVVLKVSFLGAPGYLPSTGSTLGI
jgi:hypothetical protein